MDSDIREIHVAQLNETQLEPLTAIFTLIAATLAIALPRRWAVIPMLAVAVFIPYAQRVVLAGLDFDMLRLVVIATISRYFIRGESTNLEFNRLDKTFFYWVAAMILVPCVRNPMAIVWGAGFLLDNLILYLVLRSLLSDPRDLKLVAMWMVLLSIPILFGMLFEQLIEKNYFGVFGGNTGVNMRYDAIRSQAGFAHPIHAGTFGAMLPPMLWLLWFQSRPQRVLVATGLMTSLLIVYYSKSSGPLYAFVGGLGALGLWRVRKHITTIRRCLWATLIFLHIVMKGPVWSLIFRIPDLFGFVAGSTSYHRYLLIDLSIRNIGDWWLLGTTSNKVATWRWGAQDVTNHFLVIAFGAGFLGLTFFILVLVYAFSLVGRSVKACSGDLVKAKWAWALGSLMFVHVVSFLGVGYFSGFSFFFLLTVAMISGFCHNDAVHRSPLLGKSGELKRIRKAVAKETGAFPSLQRSPRSFMRWLRRILVSGETRHPHGFSTRTHLFRSSLGFSLVPKFPLRIPKTPAPF